ncbi:MAG: hypothetical protein HY695_20810 [Deltaproteobacteria bacterium]|nr:hypothetical protein [Deltaproteobacteria bacterium]
MKTKRWDAQRIEVNKIKLMKASTLKLCLPVMAMTAQQTAGALVLPPFLDDLKYPVSAIGSLISVGPVLTLAARLPAGFVYRGSRARMLIALALSVWPSMWTRSRPMRSAITPWDTTRDAYLFLIGPLIIIVFFLISVWGCKFLARYPTPA